jgi:hypothetical protein
MKKYLYSIAVIVIVSVSIMNVNFGLRNNDLPDVFLANVEALAAESNNGQPMNCYQSIQYASDGRPGEEVTYCEDCKPIACTHWWDSGRCMR